MKEINYTDKEKVLLHLMNHRSITNNQAIDLYRISYPTKCIQLLIKEGCNIHKAWIKQEINGKVKTIKKYFIN
jgi:hypothetical protein